MRTFVIGDIHGGLKALKQLISKLNLEEQDLLIFLGDYVDGWSESAQVLDYLINLRKKQNCIFIKGNHDQYCENWLRKGIKNEKWLIHGGYSTIESYKDYSEEKIKVHLKFFDDMVIYHIDSNNRLFIHAGYTSDSGPQGEIYDSNYKWDRTLWEMALMMDKKIRGNPELYPKRFKLFSEIYIGHTPTTRYNTNIPMNGCNVWNIDTGAAFTGRLTAINVETKEYIQSDIVQKMYPKEKGRNSLPYSIVN
ncbi:metallophosphoesterase family protein [Tenacibaculum sp. 190524A05c]|uniref:metallophosphoesterase family protein n=1 Tax=Tenacibaculum platacis TaxID=3137852 RepID=UPI0031FAAC6C